MLRDVYILDTAVFLPGRPIDNDEMEKVLGILGRIPSRVRKVILRKNGIKTRYYALDPETGQITHNCATLAAEAVRRLQPYEGFTPADIQCLACGTASPDHIFPNQASMVHGELGGGPCETFSAQGACVSGLTALKFAHLNVASGYTNNAVASGAEVCSSFMRSRFFEQNGQKDAAPREILPFDSEFLRWMLSDGAGAMFLSHQRNHRPCLKIEWIETISFANILPTCMAAGATIKEDGTVIGWREFESLAAASANHCFAFKQDVKLLDAEITRTSTHRALPPILAKHPLDPDEVTWFLPHYSSDYFRDKLDEQMRAAGMPIPQERWFTNLSTKGNTGSASIYIIIEELWRSGRVRTGDKLLLFVPESARFSIGYALLTAV